MTEAEQMNGHRADERSSSSGNAASRQSPTNLLLYFTLSFLSAHSLSKHTKGHAKVKSRPVRDRNTENAGTEKNSKGVQVELKETERSKEETVKRSRGRDCTRNEEAGGLKRGVINGQSRGPAWASLDSVKACSS
ncbi:hypothetical protein M9H77_23962 [Catharanthus roseus]|uniref:Uncharacterized protein n=1 Tax=Catharanthus roseus TaxID=4058 RepID=A0ACC0AVR0_CATRO|nr:hypothetical protein M9H77_23962 [Catharanthus roseus]